MNQCVGYLARQEISKILEDYKSNPLRLEHFGFKVYSQSDEDGIIEEIFSRLEIEKGVFCEIGVEDGLECNTLYLIHKGWVGTWIEGDKEQESKIRKTFKNILDNRLKLLIGFITTENINENISNCLRFKDIDFLSIDIDGNDVYILESLSIYPKVICIEYNSKYRANLKKQQTYNPTHQWDGTDNFGASFLSINHVANKKGYQVVATNICGTNMFLVRNDLLGNKFIQTSDIQKLYNPPRYWLIKDHFSTIGHPASFGEYADIK
jgi:hypothetical protein